MHTIELLEQAFDVARELGYEIRQEWLGGDTGGACHFGGKKWIFVDLSLNTLEQLDQVTDALRGDPALYQVELPAALRSMMSFPRAA